MDTASIHEGVRRMRFSSLLDRQERGEITQEEAAGMLGVHVRTFQRWAARYEDEVRIVFEGRKSCLVFTVNAFGKPLTATMPEETDYDADFACAIFDVFDGIGWTFAPDQD